MSGESPNEEARTLIHNCRTAKYTFGDHVSLGLTSGLLAGIVMAVVILLLQAGGLMVFPYFVTVGYLFGASGILYYVGIYGLIFHLAVSVIWGLIFAFIFHTNERYSVTKGLAWAALQLLIVALALTFFNIPTLGGTILTVPLSTSVSVLVDFTIGYIAYGVTIGYVTAKYVEMHYTGNSE